MGVRRTVFWGGQTTFWTGQKSISTLSSLKFLFKLAIVYLKIRKRQIPGPGKYQVWMDHWCGPVLGPLTVLVSALNTNR